MGNSNLFSILSAAVLVIVSTAGNAELIDRGDGLIYDTVQDLTWTQNAGMFFGPRYDVTLSGVFYEGADTWVENLEFGGFDDWRLPATTQFDDPTCTGDIRNAGDYRLFYEHRAGCTGGEMEMLTYLYDPKNNSLFQSVNRTRYWSATPYRDEVDPCINPGYDVPCNISSDDGDRTNFYWQWGFTGFKDRYGPYSNVPFKTTLSGTTKRYAWAVRDGDVLDPIIPSGDINADEDVNLADYLLLMQCVLETDLAPTEEECNEGDMNQNGGPDAGDLVILSRKVMGLI